MCYLKLKMQVVFIKWYSLVHQIKTDQSVLDKLTRTKRQMSSGVFIIYNTPQPLCLASRKITIIVLLIFSLQKQYTKNHDVKQKKLHITVQCSGLKFSTVNCVLSPPPQVSVLINQQLPVMLKFLSFNILINLFSFYSMFQVILLSYCL